MKKSQVKLSGKALEEKVDQILSRSIQTVLPSKDELKKVLMSGKRLKIYIGADATGPDLHLGHSTNYLLLEAMRELGHEVIVLFGDFTAMIGDPTDKSATRVALTGAQVASNIRTWKRQLAPIVGFSRFGGAKIVKNSKWLSKLSFADVVRLSSNFTVQQMLERDMFEKRLEEEKPIHLHEFLYPLMQGYDSVALDVDVEIGGNDQTFNMMAGRTLQRNFRGKDKFVIATTLLVNPKTGKKLMSKSEGGYISLQDSARDMFGKVMALPDECIRQVFVDCTRLSLADIDRVMSENANPRDQKIKLAHTLVSMYHGENSADREESNFKDTFSSGKIADDIKEVKGAGSSFAELLLREGFIKSKSDFTRLIRDGAVTELVSGEKISDAHASAKPGTYRIGKHRFIKIV